MPRKTEEQRRKEAKEAKAKAARKRKPQSQREFGLLTRTVEAIDKKTPGLSADQVIAEAKKLGVKMDRQAVYGVRTRLNKTAGKKPTKRKATARKITKRRIAQPPVEAVETNGNGHATPADVLQLKLELAAEKAKREVLETELAARG